MGVAERGHVHAHELELCAHVGAGEGGGGRGAGRGRSELRGGDLGHLIAGRDQAVDLALPERAFADGVDVGVGGAAGVVDDDAAARAHREPRRSGKFVARPDAGGEHDEVGLELGAVGKFQAVQAGVAGDDLGGGFLGVHMHAERLDLLSQHAAAAVIELHGHEARRELHHMGFESEVLQGLAGLEPEEAAADHHAHLADGARGADGLEILDGAVDEALRPVAAGHGRHEGVGAGGEHERVVGVLRAVGGDDAAALAIDGGGAGVQMQRDAAVAEEGLVHQRKIGGGLAAEKGGKVNAVIGRAGLLAEHLEGEVPAARGR